MPESALARKLKLKPGLRAAVINAPDGYLNELRPLPTGVEMGQALRGKLGWAQVFVKNRAELARQIPRIVRALGPDSLVWISFPKATSKIQTDLTRDAGWEAVQSADLKWISLVSVNDTWSAFALRPYKPGEARQSFR